MVNFSNIFTYCFILIFSGVNPLLAQGTLEELSAAASSSEPQFYTQADSSEFDKEGSTQIFEGDVVAIGFGVVVSADKLMLDRKSGKFSATGHVVLMSDDSLIVAEELTYWLETADFKVMNAVFSLNDKQAVAAFKKDFLGITDQEIEFEANKKDQLALIKTKKRLLSIEYSEIALAIAENQQTTQRIDDIAEEYAILEKQAQMMREQKPTYLRTLPTSARERFLIRRKYWEKSIQDRKAYSSASASQEYFFKMSGRKIERTAGNTYMAHEASWTPCYCSKDEEPAWGFRSETVELQIEGYADFYHGVLEIKGMPILYLPYFKMPIKEKRQSGMLVPTFSFRSDSGNIVTQPIFFAIDPSADATLTAEYHEKRGTKVGVEFRKQVAQYSGWTLNLEGLRDRKWLLARDVRDRAQSYYFDDLENGPAAEMCAPAEGEEKSEEEIEECMQAIGDRLQIPDNNWRGQVSWEALQIIAPRLSFVTHGEITSDHRYIEDLTVEKLSEDFDSAFDGDSDARFFSESRYRFHLDAKNFYAGVGGSFGDPVLSTTRYSGLQVPYSLDLASRYIDVDRGVLPIPVYMALFYKYDFFRTYKEDEEFVINEIKEDVKLEEGSWQQLKAKQLSPVWASDYFLLSQFSEAETRQISHPLYGTGSSAINTYRYGLELQLPIDADLRLPSFLSWVHAGRNQGEGESWLRHFVTWNLKYSHRPKVWRDVGYGDEDSETQVYTYYASDRDFYTSSGNDVSQDETMIRHRTIGFAVQNTWDVFTKSKYQAKELSVDQKQKLQELSPIEQARFKLNHMTFGSVEQREDIDADDLEALTTQKSYSELNKNRFAQLNLSLHYDFIDEERREVQKNSGEKLDQSELKQPWSPVSGYAKLSLYGFTLSNSSIYNIYYKKLVQQNFSLELPTVYRSKLVFGYNISDDDTKLEDELFFVTTREAYVRLSSTLIPHVLVSTYFGKKYSDQVQDGSIEENALEQYKTVYGLAYHSPSECWQIAARRLKDYDELEERAQYLLELSIIFGGAQRRNYDISNAFIRHIPGREEQ